MIMLRFSANSTYSNVPYSKNSFYISEHIISINKGLNPSYWQQSTKVSAACGCNICCLNLQNLIFKSVSLYAKFILLYWESFHMWTKEIHYLHHMFYNRRNWVSICKNQRSFKQLLWNMIRASKFTKIATSLSNF